MDLKSIFEGNMQFNETQIISKYHYIRYLCSGLDSTWHSQFSGIFAIHANILGGRQGLHRICDDCPPSRGFETSCRLWISLLTKDLMAADAAILWRSTTLTRVLKSTWLECVSSPLCLVWIRVECVSTPLFDVDKSWVCLPRVVFYGREWGVDTL